MDSSAPTSPPTESISVTRPAVSQGTLLAVLWSGTVISLLAVATRLVVRWKLFAKFKADDYLVLIALVFSTASAITWTVVSHNLYATLNAADFAADPIALLDTIAVALQANLASYICSWSCLWAIKLSFMTFFRGLGQQFRFQRILWWSILTFLVISYVVCIGLLDYRCLTGMDIIRTCQYSLPLFIANCYSEKCNTQANRDYNYAQIRVTTTLDIVTDVLSEILQPFRFLKQFSKNIPKVVVLSGNIVWRARIQWKKKMVLACICSFTVAMIIIAIIRITVGAPGELPDLSWMLLWNAVEMTLAIVVACIASFRALYCQSKTISRQKNAIPPQPQKMRPSAGRKILPTLGTDSILDNESVYWTQQGSGDNQENFWGSSTGIKPIHYELSDNTSEDPYL